MNPVMYRKIAVESASPAGLVILMYDTLVGDIQRAIAAMRKGEIEERCKQLGHAFQVLQQLELLLDMNNGGETAKSLSQFYSIVRGKLLEAQFKQSVQILEQQIALILDIREAWQTVDAAADRTVAPAVQTPNSNYNPSVDEVRVSNWSA